MDMAKVTQIATWNGECGIFRCPSDHYCFDEVVRSMVSRTETVMTDAFDAEKNVVQVAVDREVSEEVIETTPCRTEGCGLDATCVVMKQEQFSFSVPDASTV